MAAKKIKYPPGKHPNTLANLAKARGEGKGFQPGQSGNPAGRPPGIRYVSEALRELLAGDEELVDKLARKLADRALKNSYDLNILLERTEGKVTQPIGGDPTMPIIVERIVAHITEDKNGSSSGD